MPASGTVKTIQSPFKVRLAADVLKSGGLLAYPTEAVWGLGCDPRQPQALYRLLSLKGRAAEKGLILVAADLAQLLPFLAPLNSAQLSRLQASTSHPVSWVAPAGEATSELLTGGRPSIAVRVSTHPGVVELCRAFAGPVVSTSANPSGRPPARDLLRARCYFGDRVDYYLAGDIGDAPGPSEIRDLCSNAVIRPAATALSSQERSLG